VPISRRRPLQPGPVPGSPWRAPPRRLSRRGSRPAGGFRTHARATL